MREVLGIQPPSHLIIYLKTSHGQLQREVFVPDLPKYASGFHERYKGGDRSQK